MGRSELQVAVDVGARRHRVAVGDASGRLIEEFDLEHTASVVRRKRRPPLWKSLTTGSRTEFRTLLAPAKTDAIDARCILELFRLRTHLPVAREALQEIVAVTQESERLKRLTRRRLQELPSGHHTISFIDSSQFPEAALKGRLSVSYIGPPKFLARLLLVGIPFLSSWTTKPLCTIDAQFLVINPPIKVELE